VWIDLLFSWWYAVCLHFYSFSCLINKMCTDTSWWYPEPDTITHNRRLIHWKWLHSLAVMPWSYAWLETLNKKAFTQFTPMTLYSIFWLCPYIRMCLRPNNLSWAVHPDSLVFHFATIKMHQTFSIRNNSSRHTTHNFRYDFNWTNRITPPLLSFWCFQIV